MVGMDFGGAPVGDLVGLTIPGQQGMTLLVLEYHQWLSSRRAVDPLARHFQAPALGFSAQASQSIEIAALEGVDYGRGQDPTLRILPTDSRR